MKEKSESNFVFNVGNYLVGAAGLTISANIQEQKPQDSVKHFRNLRLPKSKVEIPEALMTQAQKFGALNEEFQIEAASGMGK